MMSMVQRLISFFITRLKYENDYECNVTNQTEAKKKQKHANFLQKLLSDDSAFIMCNSTSD